MSNILDNRSKLTAGKEAPKFVDIRNLTNSQLKALGVSQLAYVKFGQLNGQSVYAIHAADGTPMAVAEDKDTAFAAILQHEMLPTLVH